MATIRERLNDVVQQVTTSLRNGVLPWRVMKDRTETYVVCNPANVVTLNPYQGRNYWLANIACGLDRKSTRLNSSHSQQSRMPSSA